MVQSEKMPNPQGANHKNSFASDLVWNACRALLIAGSKQVHKPRLEIIICIIGIISIFQYCQNVECSSQTYQHLQRHQLAMKLGGDLQEEVVLALNRCLSLQDQEKYLDLIYPYYMIFETCTEYFIPPTLFW